MESERTSLWQRLSYNERWLTKMENNGMIFLRLFPRFLKGLLMAVVCSLSLQQASGVTLAWDPNPEPDIAGYILHYGTNSGSYLTALNVGNITTNSVSGLAANGTYFFAV